MPSAPLPPLTLPSEVWMTKVVIIEDDAALLNALKFSLELEGFSVCTHVSASALRAQDLPASNGCLVIDYRLPGHNGLQLLARLRSDGVVLPAILITSHPTGALASRAADLGAAIVEKPLLTDQLSKEIRAAVLRVAAI